MDRNLEDQGHEAIAKAVASCKPPVVVIEMFRQFGDILHSTLVVRHVRASEKVSVVWAINQKFVPTFDAFVLTQLGPHAIAALPDLPPHPADGSVRVAWVTRAKTLPGVGRAFGCGVHPWGWKGGSIVDAILLNAGIGKLAVERKPWLPLAAEDLEWAEHFVQSHGLGKFVTLEYISYSLAAPSVEWFHNLVQRIPVPVVSIAGAGDPFLPGAIDGRGITFRQAKALLRRSSCFVGIGSGLSVLAATNGCSQPVVEMTPPELSMPQIGYRLADLESSAIAGEKVETTNRGVVAGTKLDRLKTGSPVAGTRVERGPRSKFVDRSPHLTIRDNYFNVHGRSSYEVVQAVESLMR